MSPYTQSSGASSSKRTLDSPSEAGVDAMDELRTMQERCRELGHTIRRYETTPEPSSDFYAQQTARNIGTPALPDLTDFDASFLWKIDDSPPYLSSPSANQDRQVKDDSGTYGQDLYGLPPIGSIGAPDAQQYQWGWDGLDTPLGPPLQDVPPSIPTISDTRRAVSSSATPSSPRAAPSSPAAPGSDAAVLNALSALLGYVPTHETSNALILPGHHANQPTTTTPPSPVIPKNAKKTLRSSRSRKRERSEQENVPVLIASGTDQSSAQPPPPVLDPSAVAEDSEPSRKRRKTSELEDTEMTPETRCGIDGCTHLLVAPHLAGARVHFRSHYPDDSAEAESSHSSKGTAGKGRTGKGRKEKGRKGKGAAKPKAEKGAKVFQCTYTEPDGQLCTHPAHADLLSLRRHVEGTHYKWGFRCPKCNRMFSRRDALTRHQQTTSCSPPRT